MSKLVEFDAEQAKMVRVSCVNIETYYGMMQDEANKQFVEGFRTKMRFAPRGNNQYLLATDETELTRMHEIAESFHNIVRDAVVGQFKQHLTYLLRT